MKKTLFILLAMICLETQAQLQKGNVLIGGALSFTANSSDQNSAPIAYSYKYTSFSVEPRAGYFVSDRAVIGLALNFSTTTSNDKSAASETKSSSNGFSFSPFYRHYFSLGNKVAIYAHSSVSYGYSKSESTRQNGTTEEESNGKITSYGVSVVPGVNYSVSEKWALEASFGGLSYGSIESDTNYETDPDNHYKATNFNINFGINYFSLGLKYFITR